MSTGSQLALVVDGRPRCRYVGELLDAAMQHTGCGLGALIVPACNTRDTAVGARLATRLASAIVGFEFGCLALLGRFMPVLRRRLGGRESPRPDLRARCAQYIELDDATKPVFDRPPELVLVLGKWLPRQLRVALPASAMVLQLEVGDEAALGLAGFDSCWRGRDDTPVRLYRVHLADDRRELLVDGHNRTKRLFALNQSAAWDRALSLLRSQLPDPAAAAVLESPAALGELVPVAPPAWQLLAYPARALVRGLRLTAQQLAGRRRWSVAIYRQNAPGTSFGAAAPVEAAPAGTFHADPLLFRDPASGIACCFVEEMDEASGRAHIAVLREHDGIWRRAGVALAEPFHLSFPFVFRFEGTLYMCPETAAAGEIRLYRCTDFPLGWEFETVLMRGVSATDTVIVPHAGRWWMLTNLDRAQAPDHQSELHVFHAASPLADNWEPVRGNPVRVDCRGGRNGGVEIVDGRIWRFGQVQSFDAYGHRLHRYELVRLARDGYQEVLRAAIDPPADSGSSGIHTCSSIDGWVAVDLLGATAARSLPASFSTRPTRTSGRCTDTNT